MTHSLSGTQWEHINHPWKSEMISLSRFPHVLLQHVVDFSICSILSLSLLLEHCTSDVLKCLFPRHLLGIKMFINLKTNFSENMILSSAIVLLALSFHVDAGDLFSSASAPKMNEVHIFSFSQLMCVTTPGPHSMLLWRKLELFFFLVSSFVFDFCFHLASPTVFVWIHHSRATDGSTYFFQGEKVFLHTFYLQHLL